MKIKSSRFLVFDIDRFCIKYGCLYTNGFKRSLFPSRLRYGDVQTAAATVSINDGDLVSVGVLPSQNVLADGFDLSKGMSDEDLILATIGVAKSEFKIDDLDVAVFCANNSFDRFSGLLKSLRDGNLIPQIFSLSNFDALIYDVVINNQGQFLSSKLEYLGEDFYVLNFDAEHIKLGRIEFRDNGLKLIDEISLSVKVSDFEKILFSALTEKSENFKFSSEVITQGKYFSGSRWQSCDELIDIKCAPLFKNLGYEVSSKVGGDKVLVGGYLKSQLSKTMKLIGVNTVVSDSDASVDSLTGCLKYMRWVMK